MNALYICCDPDNKDTIIRPCSCTTAVHHECLKKFILSELTTKPDHQNITYSPDRFLEQAVNNHGNGGGRHSSTESDSRSRGAAAQSSRNRKNNGNASDKVLRCKVCQSPYKISTQGINFSRALKKCDFVLVIQKVEKSVENALIFFYFFEKKNNFFKKINFYFFQNFFSKNKHFSTFFRIHPDSSRTDAVPSVVLIQFHG